MHLAHRAASDGDVHGLAFKDVATSATVCREKVKVISGNTKLPGEAGGPNAN